ncbi:hypothetical protein D3C87_1946480 [compost metagenome]
MRPGRWLGRRVEPEIGQLRSRGLLELDLRKDRRPQPILASHDDATMKAEIVKLREED